MIQLVLVITGIVSFIDAIFEKFGVWEKIQKLGSTQESKLIYKLSSCNFCIKFHMSFVILVLHGFCTGFNFEMVLIPFVASGLMYLIKR